MSPHENHFNHFVDVKRRGDDYDDRKVLKKEERGREKEDVFGCAEDM